jgi:hypothetical protein
MRIFLVLIGLSLFLSCNDKINLENDELSNAKWYFYSYACQQRAFTGRGIEVNPLACGVDYKVEFNPTKDTVSYHFILFNKDSLDICYLNPFGTSGVICVKGMYFIPRLHGVIIEFYDKSIIEAEMKKQSEILEEKIKNSDEIL